MRVKLAAVALLPALAACTMTPVSQGPVDCYSAVDATRYNHLYLQLDVGGSYSVRLLGDITVWGTATGQWTVSGSQISLQPIQADGQLVGFAPTLYRNPDGSLSLPKGSLPFSGWSRLAASGCGP